MGAATWQIISIIGYSLAAILFIAVIIMFFKMDIPAIYGYLTGKTAEKHIRAMREQTNKTGNRRYEPIPFHGDREDLTERIPKSKRLLKTGKTRKTGQTAGMGRNVKKQVGNDFTPRILESADVRNFPRTSRSIKSIQHEYNLDETELLVENTELQSEETELLVDETQVLKDDTESSLDETQLLGNESQVLIDETQVLNDKPQVLVDELELLDDSTQLLTDETQVLIDEDKSPSLGNTDELYPKDRPTHQGSGFNVVKDMKIVHTDEKINDEVKS